MPMSNDARSIQVVDNTDDHAIAVWRDVVVILWKRETTLDGVAATGRGVKAALKGSPEGAALMTIVEAGAAMPPAEARDALARQLAEHGEHIRCSAVVYEGAGFRAAAVRSVVTGLSLLAKQPFPHKVFATVNAASAWMAGLLPQGGLPTRDLVQAISDVRETVGA